MPKRKTSEVFRKAPRGGVFPDRLLVRDAIASVKDASCLDILVLPNTTAPLVLFHALRALFPESYLQLWNRQFNPYARCLGADPQIEAFTYNVRMGFNFDNLRKLKILGERLQALQEDFDSEFSTKDVVAQRGAVLRVVENFIEEKCPPGRELAQVLKTIVAQLKRLKPAICNHIACDAIEDSWRTLYDAFPSDIQTALREKKVRMEVAPFQRQGKTNLHYLLILTLTDSGQEYLLRVPGHLWPPFRREHEYPNLQFFHTHYGEGSERPQIGTNLICAFDDGTLLYTLPPAQHGLTKDASEPQLQRVALAFCLLHVAKPSGEAFSNNFDSYRAVGGKLSELHGQLDRGSTDQSILETADFMLKIYAYFYEINPHREKALVPCHGDPTPGVIRLGSVAVDTEQKSGDSGRTKTKGSDEPLLGLSLVDFEYSARNYRMWDLAYLVCNLRLDTADEIQLEEKLLGHYLDAFSHYRENTLHRDPLSDEQKNNYKAQFYLFKVIVLSFMVTWEWKTRVSVFCSDALQVKLKDNLQRARTFFSGDLQKILPSLDEAKSKLAERAGPAG